MKFFTPVLALSSFYAMSWASPLVAPLDNYGVIIPQWEVEVSPGGSTVVLNGTIEEVREEVLKLNPYWDTDYFPNKPSSSLAKRYDFSNAHYSCRGIWPECSTSRIREGVNYLRGVPGQPTNGPGPGNCGRVSCSYNSAIWWCNDNSKPKTLRGFSEIADGAAFLIDKCDVGGRVSGQVFGFGKWNVIVRSDSC